MSIHSYNPTGVCCREMEIEVEGDTLLNVNFYGGCEGNLTGIGRLVAGQKIDKVIELLSGVDCRGKGTSCPDQLSKALRSIKQ
ncbi:MAG: TIGR03905 family TSCPD domain-containing protein [Rikenellaceae bacterium]